MPGEFDNTLPAGTPGDFNMDAALGEIASGLGFSEPTDDLDDNSADSTGTGGDPGNADDNSAGNDPAAAAAASTSTADTAAAAAAATPSQAPAPASVDLTQPPKTWRKEATAAWATLSPEVRAEIHKREQDMYTGIEQYREGANFAWQVQGLFKPYEHVMQQAGIGPAQILPGLINAHGTLSLGTEAQKLSLMGQLIKDYAIPLPKLLAQLTGGALSDTEPFIDPQVKDLQAKLASVESRMSAQDQAAAQERQNTIRASVAAFANDPANIYFEELADDIAALIRGGVTQDIKVAYEKALWANPAVRAKEQARVAAEAESERTRKAAEAAAKAKKAMGANVRSTVRTGSPTAPKGQSIDETLQQTLAAIHARSQ